MNKKSIRVAGLALCLSMAAAGVGAAVSASLKAPVETKAATVEYKLTITKDNFTTVSYADNNKEKTSLAVCTTDAEKTFSVKWTSYQVYQSSSVMQWQKGKGYIYNSTDLGTISSVTVTSSDGSFTTYYGTAEKPTSGTAGEGKGFFNIVTGSAKAGKTSKVEVVFTVTATDYETTSVSISGSISGKYDTLTTEFDVSGFTTSIHQIDHLGGDPRDVLVDNPTYHFENLAGAALELPLEKGTYQVRVWASVDGETLTSKDNENPDKQYVTGDLIVNDPEFYTLVTDVTQLTVGNKVLIVDKDHTAAAKSYAVSSLVSSTNLRGFEITEYSANVIAKRPETCSFTIGADSFGYTLKGEDGNYLYAADSEKNYLMGRPELNDDHNDRWAIRIYDKDGVGTNLASIVAQGDKTHNDLRFNPNSGNPLFSCYASSTSQSPVKLYVLDDNPSLAAKVETFSDLYMHKLDIDNDNPDTHESDTDACIAYFDKAKAALDGAWASIAEGFASSGAMWNRYVSWAAAKGVVVTYDDGIVYNANAIFVSRAAKDYSALIIASTLIAGAAAVGGLVLLRKRKHN